MNIVLLSGGSGKRLWPLSNDVRSKQFLKLFKKPSASSGVGGACEDEPDESMVQRVFRQIRAVDDDPSITIATSRSQISAIHNQLGDDVSISVEPFRRDTFPAIALASQYLHDVKGISREEVVVVCPVDSYVEEDFFKTTRDMCALVEGGHANLVLMGIQPTYPSEKYGYIIPESKASVSKVKSFTEKPDAQTASLLIEQGGLWNGGVFAFKMSYILDRSHAIIDYSDYEDLFAKYESLESISFDYAVVEKEHEIAVIRYAGEWKDVGTWNTLTEAMDGDAIGNVMHDSTCERTNVINELDIPVLVMGMQDAIVAASPDGILVADKERSSYIKPFVDEIHGQVMFAEKSWGSFRVIDAQSNSLTVRVHLRAGHQMNYHSHEKRDEVWVVTEGVGRTIIDGMEQQVKTGDVIAMEAGCKHTVAAITDLTLVEIQLGDTISVSDKKKYELE